MQSKGNTNLTPVGLEAVGIKHPGAVHWNLSTGELYEYIVRRNEGVLTHLGPVATLTGERTGRSANDKFIVREESSADKIWWGKVNKEISAERFHQLHEKVRAYTQHRELFVQDCWAGADPRYKLPVRIITEDARHSLFARNMFIRLQPEQLKSHQPEFTVIQMPHLYADPEINGTNSEVFVTLHFGQRLVLIGGTAYAGEIKKSIFTVMNYLLPQRGIMSMHCSANYKEQRENTAVFFGLSGTGKTTLSADSSRTLIGDDEHGWSADGVFNYEGGCYAKVIRLSEEAEPEIFDTTRKFGTLLENVVVDDFTRRVDLDDNRHTENTRASYPITHIPNADLDGIGGHPQHILMLTADAFGVLPPLAKMTPEQAMYHFLSGYTAKVAGTEIGVTEPQATFSTCFGAPFMALHPSRYADLLGEKIRLHKVNCWLVNTGWTGGPYGVGQRMQIKYTRALVNAALNGTLDEVATKSDPVFGLAIPEQCPGVPGEILDPRNTWSDKSAYDEKAQQLAAKFISNFKDFEELVSPEIRAAAPRLA
jgi:phosphoenolpyruvate carboxykinase (ATP)